MPKSPSTPTTVSVRLPTTTHLLRVGRYRPGEIVAVSPADAEFLIHVKGFELVADATGNAPIEPQEPNT